MLNRLTVKGFKSIEDSVLDLKSLNVIIGPNGAGKSNLVGIFRFLNSVLAGQLQLYVGERGGPDRLLFHGEKHTPKMSFRFDFESNAYSFTLKPAAGDVLIFEEERIHYDGQAHLHKWSTVIGAGHRESKLEQEAAANRGKVSQYVLRAVQNWVVYHFHDTSDSAPAKKTQDIDDNRAFRPDAANLAAFLYWMKLNRLLKKANF